tara:strand:+ start:226 stop:645 length:420 start_codon:yes stop_codon:yes gene_type:complete
MAKISGVASYVAIDNSAGSLQDISNDLSSVDNSSSQNLLDVTGMDKSAVEKIIGLRDNSLSLSGYYNNAANMSNQVLSSMSGNRSVVISLGGNTTGNPRFRGEFLISSYNVNVADDRGVTFSCTMELQDGVAGAWDTVP